MHGPARGCRKPSSYLQMLVPKTAWTAETYIAHAVTASLDTALMHGAISVGISAPTRLQPLHDISAAHGSPARSRIRRSTGAAARSAAGAAARPAAGATARSAAGSAARPAARATRSARGAAARPAGLLELLLELSLAASASSGPPLPLPPPLLPPNPPAAALRRARRKQSQNANGRPHEPAHLQHCRILLKGHSHSTPRRPGISSYPALSATKRPARLSFVSSSLMARLYGMPTVKTAIDQSVPLMFATG